jgi:hypothetical protein
MGKKRSARVRNFFSLTAKKRHSLRRRVGSSSSLIPLPFLIMLSLSSVVFPIVFSISYEVLSIALCAIYPISSRTRSLNLFTNALPPPPFRSIMGLGFGFLEV